MGPMIVVAMMVLGVQQAPDERLKGWLTKLTDPAEKTRLDASNALINFAAQPTDELISALATCLKDSHHLVRANCVIALSRSGSKAVSAMPALRAALADRVAVVRGWAAQALASMGPAARSELPNMARGLEDPEATVRRSTADAMIRLDPAGSISAVPVLVQALRHIDSNPTLYPDGRTLQDIVRDEVARRLETLSGPAAAEAVKVLQPLLEDADAGVRRRAKQVLTTLQAKSNRTDQR